MEFKLDPTIRVLFGSETRAKILGFLANTTEPKSAYAIAKSINVTPSKAYEELRKLAPTDFIKMGYNPSGSKTYLLIDADLRRLMLRRVRLVSSADWFSSSRVRERLNALKQSEGLSLALPTARPNPRAIPNIREFVRPARKDRLLKQMTERARTEKRRNASESVR